MDGYKCTIKINKFYTKEKMSIFAFVFFLPEIPLVRYMADMTPTEKAMLTDRNCPFISLLVLTCAAAEQPKSFIKVKGDREK